MHENATCAEIKKLYDGEWVLIIDPITTKDMEIVEGQVACHSKDREEVYRKALELNPNTSPFCSWESRHGEWSLRCDLSSLIQVGD
jgi:hypothetical protein